MTREEFYQHIERFIMGMLPEEYADMTPVIRPTINQSGKYMGLMLCKEEAGGISPNFNLDLFYDRYKDMDEIEMLMAVSEEIIKHYQENMQKMEYMKETSLRAVADYEFAKSRLYISPASLMRQKEGYVEPCMRYADLCVQVRINIEDDLDHANGYIASIVVNDEILERWGKGFEEVYREALDNTPRLFNTEILPMRDVVESFKEEGIADFPDIPGLYPELYIVTNNRRNHGATNLFLPGVMNEIAEKVNGSYVVIPSSVHEVLIHPVMEELTKNDVKEFEAMIMDVNTTTLQPEDVLSNRAYFYNANTKEFGLAADALILSKDNNYVNTNIPVAESDNLIDYKEASKNIVSDVFRPQNY